MQNFFRSWYRKKFLLTINILLVAIILLEHTVLKRQENPVTPLFVSIYNSTMATIPSIVIKHGNANTEEMIKITQLRSTEQRVISMNHKPKMGFNFLVNYADRRQIEVCLGKKSEQQHIRIIVKENDVQTKVR